MIARTAFIAKPGLHLLEVRRPSRTPPFIRLRATTAAGAHAPVLVPALSRTRYLLDVTAAGPIAVEGLAAEVDSVEIRRAQVRDLPTLARRSGRDQRFAVALAPGIVLVPLLYWFGNEGRAFSRSLRLLTKWGFGIATRNLQETPGLFGEAASVEDADTAPRTVGHGDPRIGVVLHLHYPDLWPEFERMLCHIARPFQLVVTATAKNQALEARIRGAFAEAKVFVYENRGRDVAPFLQLLSDGHLAGMDLICKLHGKRSGSEGSRALLGDVWRRASLHDLVGSRQQVERIVQRFVAAPNVGMIGSGRFRLPNEFTREEGAWGENRASTLKMATRLGIPPEGFVLDYFAGTMFWVRAATLEPLRFLNLSMADFPKEPSKVDGELHHAVERLFGVLASLNGMVLENSPLEFRVPSFEPQPAVHR
jgi:lipopolysaccharide biosynthesis protein